MTIFRTGDVVLHRPSGERWLLAWGDDREVICCGYPESFALAKDCDLIKAATDEDHWKLVEQVAIQVRSSSRGARCWHLWERKQAAECAGMMHA